MTWLTIIVATIFRRVQLALGATIAIAPLFAHTAVIAADGRQPITASTLEDRLVNATPYAGGALSTNCAKRFHAKLSSQVLPAARATLSIAIQMSKPNLDLAGRWLFWDGSGVLARSARQQRLLAAQQIDARDNRMCVRSILARGGRIRCLEWKPIPPGYVPPKPSASTVDPAKTVISRAERRIASLISSRVINQGAFVELRNGTALYHLSKRTSDELISYANQPYRATICTGATEMINFYQARLAPLTRMVDAAINLQNATHGVALKTASAHARKIGDTTYPNRDNTYSHIIRHMVTSTLRPEDTVTLPKTAKPMAMLQSVRNLLNDRSISEIPKNKRGSLQKALRSMELAVYARYNLENWQRFSKSFEATFDAIRFAHKSQCTCRD